MEYFFIHRTRKLVVSRLQQKERRTNKCPTKWSSTSNPRGNSSNTPIRLSSYRWVGKPRVGWKCPLNYRSGRNFVAPFFPIFSFLSCLTSSPTFRNISFLFEVLALWKFLNSLHSTGLQVAFETSKKYISQAVECLTQSVQIGLRHGYRVRNTRRTWGSSISTFSQPFKEKRISEVVRIGSIIIFHLSKLYEKPSSSYCVLQYLWWSCRGNLKLITLGSERVKMRPLSTLP